MTVSSEIDSVSYSGDGVSVFFPVPYYFLEDSHLLVTMLDPGGADVIQIIGSQYTVSGAGAPAGGAITMLVPPQIGYGLYISRNVPATQETDYVENDPFPAESHERALDKLTMLIQQGYSTLARALLKPPGRDYYDAGGSLIKGLGDGAEDRDAVNIRVMRNYVDTAIAGVVGGFGWFLQAGIGAIQRTFQSKMREAVSAYDFGSIADGNSHPLSERYATLAEAQADYPHATSLTNEIDWAATQAAVNTGRHVKLTQGGYIINATIASSTPGQKISGDGQERTTVTATHLTGAAFRFRGQYPGISGMTITASSARTAAAHTSNGFGVHFEGPDVPDDPLVTRMRNIHAHDLVIFGQTGAAIYVVGPVTDGSSIDRCRIFGNNGHGIAIDRGQLGGRVNLAAIPPGVMNINNCAGGGNTGHIVALGHPTDTNTTQTIRVVIDNFDVNCAAMVQAVLYNPLRKHAFWASGSNNVIENCVVSGSGTETAVFVQGTQNHIRNLRQIETAHSVEVGDNVPALYTDGVFIDGVNVINAIAQNTAVVLANAPNARNIRVNIKYDSDITYRVDTYACMGLEIEQAPLVRRTSLLQSVNNSTALVDISELSYYMKPQERVRFTAVIYYQAANVTPDIKFALRGPTSPGTVLYGPAGNVKVGTTDVVEASGPATAYATNIAYGANSAIRMAVLEGYIVNGPNAGLMALRFAQLAADPTDTSVLAGSTLTVFGGLE